MRRVDLKKLYHNKASLRDYTVKWCIENDEPANVYYSGEMMVLTPEELKKGTSDGRTYISSLNGKEYKLIDFPWRPFFKQTRLI
jgi:hypothetical protein